MQSLNLYIKCIQQTSGYIYCYAFNILLFFIVSWEKRKVAVWQFRAMRLGFAVNVDGCSKEYSNTTICTGSKEYQVKHKNK